jgi:hypothetical protein
MNIARDLPVAIATLASVIAVIVCARSWMARTAHLDLSIFRPYRGDAWPVGVQEDDDVRFDWTTTATATVVEPAVGIVGISGGGVGSGLEQAWRADPSDLGSLEGSFEDVTGGPVAAEPVRRISVRHLDH